MAEARRIELDELVNRPGTYFNPQTEVLIVVDDSPELDADALGFEDRSEEDWVVVSDEVPIDEHERDVLLEAFQARQHTGTPVATEDDDEEEVDELEPDEEQPGED